MRLIETDILEMIFCVLNLPYFQSLLFCFAHSIVWLFFLKAMFEKHHAVNAVSQTQPKTPIYRHKIYDGEDPS